jgi:hypothetical protein
MFPSRKAPQTQWNGCFPLPVRPRGLPEKKQLKEKIVAVCHFEAAREIFLIKISA